MRRSLFLLLIALSCPGALAAPPPRLVVVLVIDQFRADNLTRFSSRFLPARGKKGEPGGFRYLMEKGSYFPFAQYDLLQPMTGPGHATVLSGTYPYLGGIAVNEWYSAEKKDRVYCVEDPAYTTVGKFEPRNHLGTSPRNFLGTTVGDELKNGGWTSKVVAVALKDRAAILLGGHRADLALWMDGGSFRWVSSRFYLPDGNLPAWVSKLNERLDARSGQRWSWELPAGARASAPDPIAHLGNYPKAIGEAFPHAITRGTLSELTSPAGLDLTVEAAEAALEAEKLGTRPGQPDLLAVSFSSHDYVGHGFGPDSRENEEMVVAEDRALARFFGTIAKKVPGGLANVVIALTGDHGITPSAEALAAHRMNAGLVDVKDLSDRLEARLEAKFGKGPWIAHMMDFNFWIDRGTLAARGVELPAAANELKKALLEEKAIAFAFTGGDVAARTLPPGMHERRILKTWMKERSGDVVGIVRPFFYPKMATVDHLADYSYDSSVPLLIAGPGVRAAKHATRAEVVDLAPTLSFLLGTLPPVMSEGRVLSEAIQP